MNFFERQHEVRRMSSRLVWLFALAVIGIVAVVDAAVWIGFGLGNRPVESALTVLAIVSGIAIVLIGLASWIRMLLLRRGGGGKVARSVGGVYVPEDTTDPELRRLRNVVEEVAIASGMPVPELYLLPNEPGINAFAAGWTPGDAAVAVTRGTLERLNRDELQGVIAHEFSHVINGDMRLNIRLMGVLFGILGLAVVGRIMLAGGGRGGSRRNNAGPLLLVALAALIAGYIGVFAGRLIKAAVSRQREYLADASAVQFTRQTEGIAGALMKIGGLREGSKLRSGKAEDVSHMLFGEGMNFSSMFATHPPLAKRIQVLDPTFDPAELDRLSRQWAAEPPSGRQEDAALGLAPPAAQPPPERLRARPGAVAAQVGDPSASSYQLAEGLLRSIPEPIRARARRGDTVVPLVFGLLLSGHPEVRSRQRRLLAERHGNALADAVAREAGELDGLDPALRLPLAELASSTLRQRPHDELTGLLGTITALIRADGRLSVFEYCLSTLLHRELHESMHHAAPWGERRTTLARSGPAVATLFAVLARAGHHDAASAAAAYQAGLDHVLPRSGIPFQPPAQGPAALDACWPALDGLDGPAKERVVEGMVQVIGHDQVMTVAESELLRTVCAVLHCPLPPLA
ncbi:M48 family metallopeptidase [Qaidamihabitans albus]|uniref:M48 family metallopeptidase n=1 Tax=Qaidamihabitans albus TaxID=2795733 RepID=UPI0018F1C156|nr:M48 family metallopeptidase [Qaidamihabitans albus]